jgi:hypothetical protein
MGQLNSSITRVWPVFDFLLQQDATGQSWLPKLLGLCSSGPGFRDPGSLMPALAARERLLPPPIATVLGSKAAARIGRIRTAFEKEIPPAAPFLRWLIEHPDRLSWPQNKSEPLRYGESTESKRRSLIAGTLDTRAEALEALAMHGAAGSRRRWWAFEGFTSVDCYLETENLLVLIEGKRTEPIASSTAWFPSRNQIIRNVEVAKALADGRKDYAVILCAETQTPLAENLWSESLPHLSEAERNDLRSHYRGCVLWKDIVQAICPTVRLPESVDDALAFLER